MLLDISDGIELYYVSGVIDSYVFLGELDESDFYLWMISDDLDYMMLFFDVGGLMLREEVLLICYWI